MKKSDLKSGMVVETRGKERFVLCGERFLSVQDFNLAISLSMYNDDLLLSNNGQEFDGDIIKVYSAIKFLSQVNTTSNLIWSRTIDITKTKEVTMDEIERKFGCKVKIIS